MSKQVYTLMVKTDKGWVAHTSDTELDYVRREEEYLSNIEYPPICYVLSTDTRSEDVEDTVSQFRFAMKYGGL